MALVFWETTPNILPSILTYRVQIEWCVCLAVNQVIMTEPIGWVDICTEMVNISE